jgi:hypothetical protein
MLANGSLSLKKEQRFLCERRFVKTHVNGDTNYWCWNMGCDPKHGNIVILQTWNRGRCHPHFCGDYGFHRDWDCYKSRTENVPQQARLNRFVIRGAGNLKHKGLSGILP